VSIFRVGSICGRNEITEWVCVLSVQHNVSLPYDYTALYDYIWLIDSHL
jgi:hypothetical protein